MDAVDYLNIIRTNRSKINGKIAEKKYWLEMAEGTAVKMDGERVQSSSNMHPMEAKVLEAVTIDEEIARLKKEIQDVIHTIEQLKPRDYLILHQVYVQNRSLKEIHAEAGKSYSWATLSKKRALRNLQKLLDA